MDTGTHCTASRRRPRRFLMLVAAAASLALAACSSTTAPSSGSSGAALSPPATQQAADPQVVAATIKRAFLKDIPYDSLDPVLQRTMQTASLPFTPEMEAKLQECLKVTVCETGHGTLTVAFPNDVVNTFRQSFRAELTAQAIASPEVGKIIYGVGTDLASWLANFKSLLLQKPDIIVMSSIYGSAILPVIQQAKAAGIVVAQAQVPLPPAVADVVDILAIDDVCSAYTDAAQQTAKGLGRPGSYGLYTGLPGTQPGETWQPCFSQEIEKSGFKKVIEGYTDGWTPQGQTQAANSLYASGQTPDVVAYDGPIDYFAAPYLDAQKNPPILVSDTVYYSFLRQVKDAQAKGTEIKALIANGSSWFSRIALTAGIAQKEGQKLPHPLPIPYPMVDIKDVLSAYDPAMPANAPFPTLLTPAQETVALSST